MCEFESSEYKSDCGRIINKFDIYICDLGDIDENTVGGDLKKTRPCVIVSSDTYNNPKSDAYMVAPIRTEHKDSIYNQDDINSLLEKKLKIGRLYIPLEMSPGDFRFIDITETRKVSSRNIIRYSSSILNPSIKKKINEYLMKYLFSPDEIEELCDGYFCIDKEVKQNREEIFNNQEKEEDTSVKQNSEDDKKEEVVEETNKENVVNDIKIPSGFSKIAGLVENRKLTIPKAAEKLRISESEFNALSYKYKDMSRSIKATTNKSKRSERVPIIISDDFKDVYDNWKSGEIRTSEAIILLDIQGNESTKYSRFNRMVKKYEKSLSLKN